jgi:hypothetical protein
MDAPWQEAGEQQHRAGEGEGSRTADRWSGMGSGGRSAAGRSAGGWDAAVGLA